MLARSLLAIALGGFLFAVLALPGAQAQSPTAPTTSIDPEALDGGRPLVMNLRDLLVCFVAFREEVISRRTKHLLGKARDRAHVLVGLAIAVANIDEVIKLIRASKDANDAREGLMARDWAAPRSR